MPALVSLIVVWLAAGALASVPAGDPRGLWWAEGGSAQVEVYECDTSLCSRVVWLRHPFDEHGCPLRDDSNPDPALRGRDMVGIDLFRGLRQERPGLWTDGRIYDPTSGRSYSAEVRLDESGRLLVRGYLGFRLLGRTTYWTRVDAQPRCEAPHPS